MVGQCKHVFIQGAKKEETCEKNCRGDYCKDHNPNKQKYLKEYREIKRMENDPVLQEIEEINKIEDKHELSMMKTKIAMQSVNMITQKTYLRKKYYGYLIKITGDCDISNHPQYKQHISEIYGEKDGIVNINRNKDVEGNHKLVYIPFRGSLANAKENSCKVVCKYNSLSGLIKNNNKLILACENRINIINTTIRDRNNDEL